MDAVSILATDVALAVVVFLIVVVFATITLLTMCSCSPTRSAIMQNLGAITSKLAQLWPFLLDSNSMNATHINTQIPLLYSSRIQLRVNHQ